MACVSISVRFGHLNLKKFPQNYSAQREMTVAIFPIVRNKNFGERKKNETNVLRIERNEKKDGKKIEVEEKKNAGWVRPRGLKAGMRRDCADEGAKQATDWEAGCSCRDASCGLISQPLVGAVCRRASGLGACGASLGPSPSVCPRKSRRSEVLPVVGLRNDELSFCLLLSLLLRLSLALFSWFTQ